MCIKFQSVSVLQAFFVSYNICLFVTPTASPALLFTTWVAHSPILPSLHLRHNSFSNPSVALPTSQLILQPFRCFTYVTAHSPTPLLLLLCQRLITYVSLRAAHACEATRSGSDYSPTIQSLHLRHSHFTWRAIKHTYLTLG